MGLQVDGFSCSLGFTASLSFVALTPSYPPQALDRMEFRECWESCQHSLQSRSSSSQTWYVHVLWITLLGYKGD